MTTSARCSRRAGLAEGQGQLLMSPKGTASWRSTGAAKLRLFRGLEPPEINWRALFGKVWLRGLRQPDYVWQSPPVAATTSSRSSR